MRTALDALSAEPMAPQSGYRPPRVAAACRRGSSCVTSTRSRTHSSLRTCTTTCTLISCNWQQAAAPTSSSRTNAILLAASALNAKIAYALLLLLPDCELLAGAQHAPFLLHSLLITLLCNLHRFLVARNLMDRRQQRAQPRQRRGTRKARAQLLRAICITGGGGALLSSTTAATQ